jgi:hypothetical protein
MYRVKSAILRLDREGSYMATEVLPEVITQPTQEHLTEAYALEHSARYRDEFGGLGTLCILDENGDSRMQWDKKDATQVAAAETRFNELRAKRYLAYKVDAKGKQGEVIDRFDSDAERIILHAPMVGG